MDATTSNAIKELTRAIKELSKSVKSLSNAIRAENKEDEDDGK